MFTLAILIGIYSYIIFFLGILGLLYEQYVFWITVIYLILSILIFYNSRLLRSLPTRLQAGPLRGRGYPLLGGVADRPEWVKALKDKIVRLLLCIVCLQILVNLIGALGPELAFDALWYHLTLPKLYLLFHSVSYISGGLFYYSAMPKLTEMLYIPALMFGGETLAKLIHFSFGLLTCFVLYTLSRKFVNPILSLLAVVIFYSNLVVAWESITAYIDLARAFFELLSVYAFVNFYSTQKRKWFILSAVMIGFAIATKVLAIGSLFIFLVLLTYYGWQKKATVKSILSHNFFYAAIAVSIPLPWFIFSFVNTENPFYPFFTKTYAVAASNSLINPIYFVQSLWNLFVHSPDPLSPVYIMFLPLMLVLIIKIGLPPHLNPLPHGEEIKKQNSWMYIYLYATLSLLVWYITPNTGGGRFIVPYLPVYSLLVVSLFTYRFPKWFKKSMVAIILIIAIISIGYRGVANKKYLPVIVGHETKQEFLTNNLNFHFGDFYDTDAYFAKHITSSDKVLLYGFHNLYYVDFPFVDSSYVRSGDRFNYIAVQHGTIPQQFANWKPVYQNQKTGVHLYSLNDKQWVSY